MRELFSLPYPLQIRFAFSGCVWTKYKVFGEFTKMDAPVNLDLFRERVCSWVENIPS